ncbi:cytochrome c3 family protein [Dehalobacter sp. DCM]|uniref:cytochrome c3 family protein n=1 Tax=Dehalobacter sp. DCM TaxID=2907827 RepID=UPI003081BCF3|nr:cytochrome c3 family protein [Dehalobacter sp. DCM]
MEKAQQKIKNKSKESILKLSKKTKLLIIVVITLVVLVCGGFAGVHKASDNPAFCTLCHNMQSYYDSWNNSDLLANKHAAAGVRCHDCHESSLSIQAEEGLKYITGDYQTPLEKRQFATTEFCTECHDMTSVKAKTNFAESNPHDSHNGDLNCYECHSMHQKSTVFCYQCHDFEWFNNLPSYFEKK